MTVSKRLTQKKHYAYKKRVHIVDSSGLNIAIYETHSVFDIPSTYFNVIKFYTRMSETRNPAWFQKYIC